MMIMMVATLRHLVVNNTQFKEIRCNKLYSQVYNPDSHVCNLKSHEYTWSTAKLWALQYQQIAFGVMYLFTFLGSSINIHSTSLLTIQSRHQECLKESLCIYSYMYRFTQSGWFNSPGAFSTTLIQKQKIYTWQMNQSLYFCLFL